MFHFVRPVVLSTWILLTVVIGSSHALITGARGNKPVADRSWPQGTLPLANLKIRLGWWEGPPFGGGETHFLYRGDTKAFAESLDRFSKIIAPKKVLVIHDGEHESFWLRNEKNAGINWQFTVWNAQSWHHLYNNPTSHWASSQPNYRKPVAPPQLDVYLSDAIDWSQINVPKGITVTDRRLSSVGLDASVGAVVQGLIFDMQTSKPIVDAELVLKPRDDKLPTQSIRSTKFGKFDLRKVPAATYQVSVRATGYASRHLGDEAMEKQTLIVYENIQLVKATEVSGTLKDDAGISIANAKVRLSNPMGLNGRGYSLPASMSTTTDANGDFTFAGVPTGYTQFHCSAEGYHFSDLFTVHKVPGSNPQLTMTAAGTIRVTVLDGEGLPLQGDHIINIEPDGDPIGKWGGSAKVDIKAGENIFQRVPPGRYLIEAHPNGRSTRYNNKKPSQWIEVKSAKEVVVELQYPK